MNPDFIQFGRAEQAAKEAAEAAIKRIEAQRYAMASGENYHSPNIPQASAIPNSGRTLRPSDPYAYGSTAAEYSSAPARPYYPIEETHGTAKKPRYITPYAKGGADKPSTMSASAHRGASTSVKLRENARGIAASPAKKSKLCPLQFFAAVLAFVGMIIALIQIGSWDAGLLRSKAAGTINVYLSENPQITVADGSAGEASAYRAGAWFLVFGFSGFAASLGAWRSSNILLAAASSACYLLAMLAQSALAIHALFPLLLSVLSVYVLYSNAKMRRAKQVRYRGARVRH